MAEEIDVVINKDGSTEEVDKGLTPSEYFEKVKGKIKTDTEEELMNLYNVSLKKLKKFMVTGQQQAAKLLYAKCRTLEKEYKIVKKGITKYVTKQTIEDYIDKVADKTVIVVELENYERDIPDDLVDKIADTKDTFDQFFVCFTDYTGEKRSKVKKERREKDPILFGNVFEDGLPSDKMYYIGDWVDEYCELTLSKMMDELTKKYKKEESEFLKETTDFTDLESIETALFGGDTK